jgi:hypothetical protein
MKTPSEIRKSIYRLMKAIRDLEDFDPSGELYEKLAEVEELLAEMVSEASEEDAVD